MADSDKSALSSTIYYGSDEVSDLLLYCVPCDFAKIRKPAFGFCTNCEEHVCELCYNHHQRSKASRHHKLLNKNDMPKTQISPSRSVIVRPSNELTKPCPKHTNEMIKYYCHSDNECVCNKCFNLKHNTCHVIYIPDISMESLDSKEYDQILTEISTNTSKCGKTKRHFQKLISKSNSSLTDVMAEVKSLRQNVEEKLNEIEKATEQEARQIQNKNEATLQKIETLCDDALQALQASYDSVKQINKSRQADNLFLELHNARKLMAHNNNMISNIQTQNHLEKYYFVPSKAVSDFLLREKSFGNLAVKTYKHEPQKE